MSQRKYWEKRYIGKTFGRLKVLCYDHSQHYESGYSRVFWKCLCECGNTVLVRSDSLTRGNVKSCGCLLNEYNSKKHGHRTPKGQTSFIKLYHNYRSSARKRNLDFCLSKEQFSEFLKQDCHYCGSPPSGFYQVRDANGGILYNGIDRVDSSRGYTLDNVVTCCGICNRAKLDLPVDDFMLWISKLATKSIVEERIYGYWNTP